MSFRDRYFDAESSSYSDGGMLAMTTRSMFLSVTAALCLGAGLLLPAPVSAGADAPAATPTFTKDVAPILMRSCVQCHRPGQVAPMSLLTYEEARPWVRS